MVGVKGLGAGRLGLVGVKGVGVVYQRGSGGGVKGRGGASKG